ncbi:hypothetical protein [Chitinilyticum piscinae]|uniref:Uncharacterized protein n=1 Tax=Chitinilyticum piscinae TaxID=2866724 RepID=A0A8J7K7G2_9NEIS|nr:hypothetical protein [Chitinilyticum piscinae]MBE9608008.1 hypothetical protein [Chitinilyticum piscinae]
MPLPGSSPADPMWQRVLARGFWRNLIWHGALGWGIPFAALFAAIQQITQRSTEFLPAMLQALPLGLIAGSIYAWANWGYASIQAIKARRLERDQEEDQ